MIVSMAFTEAEDLMSVCRDTGNSVFGAVCALEHWRALGSAS